MKRWQLSGKLPRAPLDDYYMEHIQASLKPMYDYVCQNISNESVHLEFDISLGKYQVSGSLVTHGNQIVEMALSKSLGSSFFSFWLKHVFWSLYCSRSDSQKHIGRQQNKESRLIGPESEIVMPLLSAEKAEQFALECCQFFESASSEPNAFFSKSTYALLFESESKAKGAFSGNQNIPGENSDLYWQRYCLMKNSLMKNSLMTNGLDKNGLTNAQSDSIDWQVLPDIESSLFFQQVQSMKESIEIKKIQLETLANKQRISAPEIKS